MLAEQLGVRMALKRSQAVRVATSGWNRFIPPQVISTLFSVPQLPKRSATADKRVRLSDGLKKHDECHFGCVAVFERGRNDFFLCV